MVPGVPPDPGNVATEHLFVPGEAKGHAMRVLGIDPGPTRCGVGVVAGTVGRQPVLVGADVIRTPATVSIAERLLALETGIEHWLAEYQPDAVAVERVFSQHNVSTVMGTAQAGAVAISALSGGDGQPRFSACPGVA